MNIFGRNLRYCPEETAKARLAAFMSGEGLRRVARLRVYAVTTEYDAFEKRRIVYGLFAVVTMHLVLGLEYLLRRLKDRGPGGGLLALLLCAVCLW